MTFKNETPLCVLPFLIVRVLKQDLTLCTLFLFTVLLRQCHTCIYFCNSVFLNLHSYKVNLKTKIYYLLWLFKSKLSDISNLMTGKHFLMNKVRDHRWEWAMPELFRLLRRAGNPFIKNNVVWSNTFDGVVTVCKF